MINWKPDCVKYQQISALLTNPQQFSGSGLVNVKMTGLTLFHQIEKKKVIIERKLLYMFILHA